MSKPLGNLPLAKKKAAGYYQNTMSNSFSQIPLFEGLCDETLAVIKPLLKPCTCHEGIIFQQGDPAIHLYLLISGTVDIIYKPYDAPELAITTVKPYGIFGWSAISEKTLYTSGAVCREECQAIRVLGNDVRTLCAEHPRAGEAFLDRLAESVSSRWHNAHKQVRDILSQGVFN